MIILRNSTSTTALLLAVLLAVLAGCSSADINSGRGAWNAPEYVYQPRHIKRKYAKAVKPMTSGDYAKAEERLLAFIDKYPGYPGAHVNLAIVYDKLEQADNAFAQLDLAEDLIKDYPPALNQRGIMKRRAGDFAGAEEAWTRATRKDPTYLNSWYNLGVLYDLYLQDLQMALDAYEEYQRQRIESGKEKIVNGRYIPPSGVEADPEVDRWIADLERRIGTARAAQASESTSTAESL